jgi:hypothetical protein
MYVHTVLSDEIKATSGMPRQAMSCRVNVLFVLICFMWESWVVPVTVTTLFELFEKWTSASPCR